jgi:hypothetical protein
MISLIKISGKLTYNLDGKSDKDIGVTSAILMEVMIITRILKIVAVITEINL